MRMLAAGPVGAGDEEGVGLAEGPVDRRRGRLDERVAARELVERRVLLGGIDGREGAAGGGGYARRVGQTGGRRVFGAVGALGRCTGAAVAMHGHDGGHGDRRHYHDHEHDVRPVDRHPWTPAGVCLSSQGTLSARFPRCLRPKIAARQSPTAARGRLAREPAAAIARSRVRLARGKEAGGLLAARLFSLLVVLRSPSRVTLDTFDRQVCRSASRRRSTVRSP